MLNTHAWWEIYDMTPAFVSFLLRQNIPSSGFINLFRGYDEERKQKHIKDVKKEKFS